MAIRKPFRFLYYVCFGWKRSCHISSDKIAVWKFCQYNCSYTSDPCWNSSVRHKSQPSPALPSMSLVADVGTAARAVCRTVSIGFLLQNTALTQTCNQHKGQKLQNKKSKNKTKVTRLFVSFNFPNGTRLIFEVAPWKKVENESLPV